MPITVHKTHDELRFIVSGPLCQRIIEWERRIDERVFQEQLSTGLFRGQPLDEQQLELMRAAQDRGHIMPYYGAGGSRGACTYSFRTTDGGYSIEVENAETGGSITLTDNDTSLNTSEVEEPSLIFRIDGAEHRSVRTWAQWSDADALAPRYIYRFSRVSLGRWGYTVRVANTETGGWIDATHYADW
jgi:hypothetical protein